VLVVNGRFAAAPPATGSCVNGKSLAGATETDCCCVKVASKKQVSCSRPLLQPCVVVVVVVVLVAPVLLSAAVSNEWEVKRDEQ
jgi:hypothetical protein